MYVVGHDVWSMCQAGGVSAPASIAGENKSSSRFLLQPISKSWLPSSSFRPQREPTLTICKVPFNTAHFYNKQKYPRLPKTKKRGRSLL